MGTNNLHRYIEITFDGEYTISIGLGASTENDLFSQIEDPMVSRILNENLENYLYPHNDIASCQVEGIALTRSQKLNNDQRHTLELIIKRSKCTPVDGVSTLKVEIVKSRFKLLVAQLYSTIDQQITGHNTDSIYFI